MKSGFKPFPAPKQSMLRSLIDRLDWKSIEIGRLSTFAVTDLTVEFLSSKKNEVIDKIKCRIGKDIIDQLGWMAGDKIVPLYHPDNQLSFLLVKSDHGKGYSLVQEAKSTVHSITYKWPGDIPLERMKPTKVEYEIYKGQLVFQVNNVNSEYQEIGE